MRQQTFIVYQLLTEVSLLPAALLHLASLQLDDKVVMGLLLDLCLECTLTEASVPLQSVYANDNCCGAL